MSGDACWKRSASWPSALSLHMPVLLGFAPNFKEAPFLLQVGLLHGHYSGLAVAHDSPRPLSAKKAAIVPPNRNAAAIAEEIHAFFK